MGEDFIVERGGWRGKGHTHQEERPDLKGQGMTRDLGETDLDRA